MLETPRTSDLYAALFPKPKDRREAMGLTHPDMVGFIGDEGLERCLERVKSDNAFVRQYALESLRESLTLDYGSYILALVMGAGKTILMGSIVATEFAMAMEYPDGLLLVLMLAMLLWAVALVLVQCTPWLKTGTWQPVPAVAVFMSPEAQTFNLRLAEDRISPLDLAPSWTSFHSEEAVAESIAGQMGLSRILAWLLDLSLGLTVWLVGTSVLFGGASGMLAEAARANAKK